MHWWARSQDGEPLITCFPPKGRQATVPFIGFAEAFVLSSFRKAGVPLQRIRPAVEVLKSEIGVEHALASKRLYTDGAEVLYDYASKAGEGELMELVAGSGWKTSLIASRPAIASLNWPTTSGFRQARWRT